MRRLTIVVDLDDQAETAYLRSLFFTVTKNLKSPNVVAQRMGLYGLRMLSQFGAAKFISVTENDVPQQQP